jgi:hypothetical protein
MADPVVTKEILFGKKVVRVVPDAGGKVAYYSEEEWEQIEKNKKWIEKRIPTQKADTIRPRGFYEV